MVQAHWFMDTYIVRLSLRIYYHSLFYSLGHDVTIVTSDCPIMKLDTMVVPEWYFFQTIVQYDITIVQYDVTIVAPWREDNIGKHCLVNMVFWVSMHYYWKSNDQEMTNQHWVFTFDI